MIYLQLAWVFFIVGVFGFGGGMAMISMIKMETVDNYGWLTSEEFSNVLAVSQVTPGPISINTATYVGYTQGGIIGCLTASLALCLPACILMFFIIIKELQDRQLLIYKEYYLVKSPEIFL